MADRKQTPDILGEILGGEAPPASTTSTPEPRPAARSKPTRRTPSRDLSQKSPPKPQSWEYMEVVFRDYGGYRPRFINGRELGGWKRAPLIHEYLNQLGEQGWELAALGSRIDMQMPAYFKRLKRP